MSNTLFLEEKLFGALAEAKSKLEALQGRKDPTKEEDAQIKGLKTYFDALYEFSRINALVEYGESSKKLEDKSVLHHLPDVLHIYPLVDMLDYLEPQRMVEISLVGGFGTYSNEPTVFMLFRGNMGALGFLRGLRYVRDDVFAAKHPEQNFGAEQQIRNLVIRPIRVGLHDLAIYSVPIFRPDPEVLPLANIPGRINYYLRPFKRDGYIQWEDESVRANIFSLFVHNKWWEINPS